jgi:hypothetical protein
VVSFTPRPLHPPRKCSLYPSDRRLSGPQSRSGGCEEEKKLIPAGNRTLADQPVTIHTELFRVSWIILKQINHVLYWWMKYGIKSEYFVAVNEIVIICSRFSYMWFLLSFIKIQKLCYRTEYGSWRSNRRHMPLIAPVLLYCIMITINYELDTWKFNTFYPEARNTWQGQQIAVIFPLPTHRCYEMYKNYINSHYISYFSAWACTHAVNAMVN